MNRGFGIFLAALLLAALLLVVQTAGQRADQNIIAQYDQIEQMAEFREWQDMQDHIAEAQPFKARPVQVSGIGKIKAQPDIAVLYGRIETENDYDYQAYHETAKIINKVQAIIAEDRFKGADIKISFTDISSHSERAPECLRHNSEASARQQRIQQDNWYNQRIAQQKDSQEKLRPELKRIGFKTCPVTRIKGSGAFTLWVNPPELAGELIKEFTQAGVTKIDLAGYDFSNYDTLYKQASAAAVENARAKAEMIARRAGTKLTTLEDFRVQRPDRTGRFGQQATIISPHARGRSAPVDFKTVQMPIIVQEASTELVTVPATYETVTEPYLVQDGYTAQDGSWVPPVSKTVTRRVIKTPASTQERMIPAVTRMETRRVPVYGAAGAGGYSSGYSSGSFTSSAAYNPMVTSLPVSPMPIPDEIITTGAPSGSANQTNALKMILMAGPQTVSVTAYLTYQYETPLDGIIITEKPAP